MIIDPITTIDEYLSQHDWRVKANAIQEFIFNGNIPSR